MNVNIPLFQIIRWIFILYLLTDIVNCCGKKNKNKKNNKPNTDDNKPTNNGKNPLGDNVKINPYDNSNFQSASGGPVNSADELNCDFESSCCWTNEKAPIDQLDWNVGEGQIDDANFQKLFNTNDKPSGKFLIIYVTKPNSASDQALFYSCSIACSSDPVKITLKHWASKGVVLQVCQRSGFFTEPKDAALTDCQDILTSDQPGPSTFTLPAAREFTDLVIVAKNFADSSGGVAIVDNFKVEYQNCPSNVTESGNGTGIEVSPPPVTGGPADTTDDCSINCNFESGPCTFFPNAGSNPNVKTKEFKVVQGQIGNKVTGVRNAAEGSSYAGVELKPNEQASLISDVNLKQDRVVKFKSFDATDHIAVQACCDTSCTYAQDRFIKSGDRRWKNIAIFCPKGTRQITYNAVNTGYNFGAVGLDDVQLFNPSGTNPQDATEPACPGSSSGPPSSGNSSRTLKKKKFLKLRRRKKTKKLIL